MKNLVLTALIMLISVGMSLGQTTYIDFETNANPIGYDFGGNGHTFGVDNPNKTGNTSAKVGKVTTGNETWSGIAIPIGGSITFSATDTTFSLDVLSDVTGQVLLKLENVNNNKEAVEKSLNYTTVNAWQTLTYYFPDTLKAGVYSQIVLFFNFGTTDATTWYFDNVIGPDAAFGSDVNVNLKVEDKLGKVKTSVGLKIEGEDVALTKTGNMWTAQKTMTPYKITVGGGEYETIIVIDGINIDTTTITVKGGEAAMDWNYLYLVEDPEDGTALAISVGTTPPAIDGVIDDVWGNAKLHPLQKRDWYGSPTGLYSYFKMMWDIDYIYYLQYIDDATPDNDGADPWENDNLEMFFDMNRSAATPYDGDDIQIRTIRGLDTWTGSGKVDNSFGADLKRGQKELADNKGYIIELAIPWSSLSATFLPIVNTKFNFDCTVADVADGVGRDYIISWNTTADINYMNTSQFGTITISDKTKEEGTTSMNTMETMDVSVYPNPVNDVLTISSDKVLSNIKIVDITGKTVKTSAQIGKKSVEVNVSDLNKGFYILIVEDVASSFSYYKIKVD